eukprot:gnl/TRDRNA2_/TRDRNA2_49928_c0_seq1.p1 gnl/TRDRNA2_/TRDRNA2_49928_c0~~gnl/TRDRNA2_/TRDRNA2_49928_c0_seq1.p1  ORF type:complete len:212 (+),score=49.32 gnl/TRDRNA2_/TRDRNA2_49928_c0_seq1:66-638(+)
MAAMPRSAVATAALVGVGPTADEAQLLVAIMRDVDAEVLDLVSNSSFDGMSALDGHGRSALHLAIAHGMEQAAVKIVQHPRFLHVSAQDEAGRTALHLAALYDLPEAALAILASELFGADACNAKDQKGQTALHWAAREGSTRVVEAILLAPQADLQALDENGDSAEELALQNGHQKAAAAIRSRERGYD